MLIISQRGIGLLEVLVTIAITTVGLLGLSAMQMQSIQSVSDSGNRTHAISIANDLINRIRANEVARDSYLTAGILCSNVPQGIKMCSSYFQDGASQAPQACTNSELAQFDLWDAVCGTSALTGSNSLSSSASFVATPGAQIVDLGDEDISITITWFSRSSGTDEDGEAIYYIAAGEEADNKRETYNVVFRP